MKFPLSALVAIVVGILILLGYFVPIDMLASLRSLLLQWAIILAAFALIVGVFNLLRVHWSRIRLGKASSPYSLVLIISLILTVIVVGYFGPAGTVSVWIFNNIQVPIEASLMAILAVVLAYASIRMLRRRTNTFSIIFVITALLVLLGTAPLYLVGEVKILSDLRSLIVQVPAVAGARGILLGVALGTIATGVRILMGIDRPYGG